MGEMRQRGARERATGRSVPWLAWMWAGLALVWIVLALVDPSGFHTTMAVVWSVLAAVQLASVAVTRRRAAGRRGAEGPAAADDRSR